MFAKIFQTIYDGTLGTRGPWQALVTFQQMLILADRSGVVDMTPEAIARRTTIPLDIIRIGIAELEKEDLASRLPRQNGRRIVRIAEHREWGWVIVNYEHYHKLRSVEDRKEYFREKQRESRERRKAEKEAAEAALRAEQEKVKPVKHVKDVKEITHGTGLDGTVRDSSSVVEQKDLPEGKNRVLAKKNWLAPFLTIWKEFFPKVSDKAIAGQLAKALRPLTTDNSEAEICDQLRKYLRQVGPQYANPAGFARAYGTWTGAARKGKQAPQEGREELKEWLDERGEL